MGSWHSEYLQSEAPDEAAAGKGPEDNTFLKENQPTSLKVCLILLFHS